MTIWDQLTIEFLRAMRSSPGVIVLSPDDYVVSDGVEDGDEPDEVEADDAD